MANMYRDVNLSEVNESYIGKELKVAGWVENIRDHGGVSFIDLRDMYGVLQVVLRDTTLLDGIHKEECIAIEGIMEQRDEETWCEDLFMHLMNDMYSCNVFKDSEIQICFKQKRNTRHINKIEL